LKPELYTREREREREREIRSLKKEEEIRVTISRHKKTELCSFPSVKFKPGLFNPKKI
jgi:hypothetical protein